MFHWCAANSNLIEPVSKRNNSDRENWLKFRLHWLILDSKPYLPVPDMGANLIRSLASIPVGPFEIITLTVECLLFRLLYRVENHSLKSFHIILFSLPINHSLCQVLCSLHTIHIFEFALASALCTQHSGIGYISTLCEGRNTYRLVHDIIV